MRTASQIVAIVFIGVWALPAPAQEPKQPPSAETVAAQANEFLQAQVAVNRFSGSVLVAKGEQVLLAKGLGLANVEHEIPNTPQTKFRLGSITKQFTAMAILILQEQGKLSVEDLASKHVEGTPEAWKEVTIHHLLTHTSGIPSFTGLPGYRAAMPLPSPAAKTLDRVRELPLEFTPGEKFNYSNSGYVLLGQIIEKVSGKSYGEFLRESIFQPLGLADTGYDSPEKILPHRAAGYRREGDGVANAPYLDMTIPHGAGALYSTATDLHRWSQALASSQLISSGAYEKMFTPGKSNYGYGWIIDKQFGRQRMQHGGGINGFSTFIARYPDEKLCVVVLSNIEGTPAAMVASGLAAIALGEPYELPKERKFVKLDAKILDAYTGEYEIGPNLVLAVTRDGDRLLAQPTGQPKAELHPQSDAQFFVKEVSAEITFVKDDEGQVTHLILKQGERETKAKRIKGTP
ncbi:MAG TPA: serine hydrolase [Pirellulaceae bacterium]|nr:serine hydrolase [Pirellulaceae bacterium]